MTLLDTLLKRPNRGQLETEVKRLAMLTTSLEDQVETLLGRNATLGSTLEADRHALAATKDENVELRRLNRELEQQVNARSKNRAPEFGDPAARALILRLLDQDRLPNGPFSDLCHIGPNGCISHYDEKDCSVAWLKTWANGNIATPGVAALAMTMTGVHDAPDLLVQALTDFIDAHEADGALGGLAGAGWRHKIRTASAMRHAIQSNV